MAAKIPNILDTFKSAAKAYEDKTKKSVSVTPKTEDADTGNTPYQSTQPSVSTVPQTTYAIPTQTAYSTPAQQQAQSKVSSFLASPEINPFLDKNGNVFNEFINYQKALDSDKVSSRAKAFIQQATGLAPTVMPTVIEQTPVAGQTEVPTGGGTSEKYGPAPYDQKTGNSIVDAAQRYIGTPYVWGGESMDEGGMDCSGFVYNALRDAGYNVGRTTAQGYRSFGTTVNKADMQPGDLIFFGKNNNDASHIGIYIGNGQMIHSSGGSKNTKSNPGKGVSIANVDYRSDFLEARRY